MAPSLGDGSIALPRVSLHPTGLRGQTPACGGAPGWMAQRSEASGSMTLTPSGWAAPGGSVDRSAHEPWEWVIMLAMLAVLAKDTPRV